MRSAASLAGVDSDTLFHRNEDRVVEELFGQQRGQAWVRNVPSRLQDGVTCGLVCLLCAGDYLLLESHGRTCDELLKEAIERGYSLAGEMFDARNVAALCESFFGLRAVVSEKGAWTVDEVAKHICSGGLCLVPYDCDRNFSPGMFRGSKSHWAVVVGFVVADGSGEGDKVKIMERNSSVEPPDTNIILDLICIQPKSKRLAVWKSESVRDSNAQLEMSSGDFGTLCLEESLKGLLIYLSSSIK